MPITKAYLATTLGILAKWQRAAVPLLAATQGWEVTAVQEPNVIYDNGTWKLWYTGDWANAATHVTVLASESATKLTR